MAKNEYFALNSCDFHFLRLKICRSLFLVNGGALAAAVSSPDGRHRRESHRVQKVFESRISDVEPVLEGIWGVCVKKVRGESLAWAMPLDA